MSALAAFTQTILLAQMLSQSEAEDLVENLREITGSLDNLEDLVSQSNLNLQQLARKIVKIRHPKSEDWIYTLTSISSAGNPEIKHETSQENFLRAISMCFANDRVYEFTADQAASLQLSHQNLLALTDEGWLELQESGSFMPSIRLLIEGEKYLHDNYENSTLYRCLGCSNYMLFGRFCQNSACNARTHRRCDVLYRRQQQLDADTCPKCGGKFEEPNNDD